MSTEKTPTNLKNNDDIIAQLNDHLKMVFEEKSKPFLNKLNAKKDPTKFIPLTISLGYFGNDFNNLLRKIMGEMSNEEKQKISNNSKYIIDQLFSAGIITPKQSGTFQRTIERIIAKDLSGILAPLEEQNAYLRPIKYFFRALEAVSISLVKMLVSPISKYNDGNLFVPNEMRGNIYSAPYTIEQARAAGLKGQDLKTRVSPAEIAVNFIKNYAFNNTAKVLDSVDLRKPGEIKTITPAKENVVATSIANETVKAPESKPAKSFTAVVPKSAVAPEPAATYAKAIQNEAPKQLS